MTRSELLDAIKEQMDESGVEEVGSFATDLADRLDSEFGIIDEDFEDEDFDEDEDE